MVFFQKSATTTNTENKTELVILSKYRKNWGDKKRCLKPGEEEIKEETKEEVRPGCFCKNKILLLSKSFIWSSTTTQQLIKNGNCAFSNCSWLEICISVEFWNTAFNI